VYNAVQVENHFCYRERYSIKLSDFESCCLQGREWAARNEGKWCERVTGTWWNLSFVLVSFSVQGCQSMGTIQQCTRPCQVC